MNIAPVLVIFGTVRMCPGDKIGIEMPSKLKGKYEKRAPIAHRSLRDQSDVHVQKINLGEETQNISQKLPFQKHVSCSFLLALKKSQLCVPTWLQSQPVSTSRILRVQYFTGVWFRTELVAAQRI